MKDSKKIKFESYEITISYKKIKNINLKVKQNLEICLSVPNRISDLEIEKFINSRALWIKSALSKFENSSERGFCYLGQKYNLKRIHKDTRTPEIEIHEKDFLIHLHEGIPEKTTEKLLNKHFEARLIEVTQEFFEKWERALGISKNSLQIKKMKGKWGYCHTKNHDICLNLDLIKKDLKFIEYVVLHELCHILVPNHGPKFKNLLNIHMPQWKQVVKEFSI